MIWQREPMIASWAYTLLSCTPAFFIGEISPSELSDLIHEFHDGSARSVYKTYSNLDREQLVARAIGIGLLEESEVSDEIRERLSSSIGFYRDHYEIDEGDPLARLRAARTSGA